MRATDILRQEHEAILGVLELLEAHAAQIRAGRAVDPEFAQWCLGFLHHFAEGHHHGKEEGVLFPALIRHGMPKESGPIAIMLAEHEQGRAAVRRMEAAAARGDDRGYAAVASDYAALLRQHIAKENEVLFALADRIFSADDEANALQAFGKVVHDTGGVLVRERYLPAVDHWRQLFGL